MISRRELFRKIAGALALPALATIPFISFLAPANAVTTSGITLNFTEIPSGTKRITILFQGVSLCKPDSFKVQVGSGGQSLDAGNLNIYYE